MLGTSSANTQNNYFPGYVVLKTNDTLFGQIQDRNIKKGQLLNKIKFKSKTAKRKKYSAEDLNSYKIGNTVFESRWYDENSNFLKFNYTNKYGVGEKIFLRLNVKGKLSCYTKEFVDYDSILINGFELFLKEGDTHFQRANQGLFGLNKKKLFKYFEDCPALVASINTNKLKRAFEVANYYNNNCDKAF